MTSTLNALRQAPASGAAPTSLVVLLHGLGADGADLMGLAPYWAQALPNAAFVAPDAPEACDMSPNGYQWFSLQDRSSEKMIAGAAAASGALSSFIDYELAANGLGPGALAIVGFSQGTMMALQIGLRRLTAPAAILGYSGALVSGPELANEILCRPPVMLVHGDADDIVPFQAMQSAADYLTALEVPVQTLRCKGLGHGIDEAGLQQGGQFLIGAMPA